jgi:hypothetical protein
VSSKPCFGKEWERGDPVCVECIDEYNCEAVYKRKRGRRASAGTKGGGFEPNANQADYGYRTNKQHILPADGEHPAARIGKNMAAGAISAMGGEVCVFFQEYRFPFVKKSPVREVEEVEPEKPVAKKRVAKKKPIDDDDLIDVDLD